jgi:hypothetical protein
MKKEKAIERSTKRHWKKERVKKHEKGREV